MTRPNSPRRPVLFALGMLVMMVLVGIAGNAEQFATPDTRASAQRDVLPIEQDLGRGSDDNTDTSSPPSEPIEPPQWLVTTLAVLFGASLLYLLSRQRFSFRLRRPSVTFARDPVAFTEEEQADAIAEMARDLIDELRAGDSPRYAIQRAYAAVETGFGAKELARKHAETPLRYLDRIFGRHRELKQPLEELTGLFQRARFSTEPIDEPMRARAIEALSEIRDHYQSHAWRKIERRRGKVRA